MNWYFWSVILSSRRIRTRPYGIRILVKFYNHTLWLRYGCIPIFFSVGASRMKAFIKINARQQIMVLYKQLPVVTYQTDTCELAFATQRSAQNCVRFSHSL